MGDTSSPHLSPGSLALYHLGRFGEAISVLENVVEPWSGAGPLATLALAQVAAGDRAGARRRLDRIVESGDFFAASLVHAALGEVDRAFDSFRRVESPGPWPALAVHHLYGEVWGPLRDDPRHADVVKTVKRSWGVTDPS